MNTCLHDTAALMALLEDWVGLGWLRELDFAFARFLDREVPGTPAPVLLAATLASHQLGRGHVCLDLDDTLADPGMALSLPPDEDELPDGAQALTPGALLSGLGAADWAAILAGARVVGRDDEPENRPLVLVGHRLYLRRYRRCEQAIERRLQHLMAQPALTAGPALKPLLDELFPDQDPARPDWQKIACALAAGAAFSLITGGPGTGKTTTVVRLLALLQGEALQTGRPPLQIRLAAPTGKAAARLKESIGRAISGLPGRILNNVEWLASIPTEVATLHRLLGSRPDTRLFRHNARNPLPLDVLVVDEGSMVDLEMMATLLEALPPHARFFLLGDKDQLASVEAGSVLGDLCRRAEAGHYTAATLARIRALTGTMPDTTLQDADGIELDQHVVMLRESRRFIAGSGIGRLAAAVNRGELATLRALWQEAPDDLRRIGLSDLEDPRFEALILGSTRTESDWPGHAGYLRRIRSGTPPADAPQADIDQWAAGVLAAHGRFQLLCALRKGPWGVTGLNERIETLARQRGLIQGSELWYAGRPVIVTRNDYSLGLMNGDIGICLPRPAPQAGGSPVLRVAFPRDDGSGGIRWVLPSRLQGIETVFALTVHKSQGSEFDHCALLLPPRPNPILTRELVYTGITRARQRFTLIDTGRQDMLIDAAGRSVQRSGGLFS
ncbi:exodeoxyribonuclease V subunit alpha [Uliginosibacterium paludis]|uniref:RecBCD enzyme subunit RecD n=1 Tax=Uliginosibacterium paludis TaxID=1615952 RepID=A0ABV2CUU0_9RHOO